MLLKKPPSDEGGGFGKAKLGGRENLDICAILLIYREAYLSLSQLR